MPYLTVVVIFYIFFLQNMMTQTMVVGKDDALARDVANTLLPVRKRKRKQRRNSDAAKWQRGDSNVENRPLGPGEEVMHGGPGDNGIKDESGEVNPHCSEDSRKLISLFLYLIIC